MKNSKPSTNVIPDNPKLRGYLVYLAAFTFILGSAMLISARMETLTQILQFLFLNFVSLTLALALVLVFVRISFPRQRSIPAEILLYVGVGIAAGAIRAVSLNYLHAALDYDLGLSELPSSLILSIAVGGIAVPAIFLFLDIQQRYENKRIRLIEEKVGATTGSHYPDILLGFLAEVKIRLSNNSAGNKAQLAYEIRQLINSNLRPLSRSIWEREADKLPNLSLLSFFRHAIHSNVYSSWVVLAWFLVNFIPSTRIIEESPLIAHSLRVLILLLGLYVLRLAQSKAKAPNHSAARDLGIFIAGLILIGSLQAVIGLVFSKDINLVSHVGFAIANSISLIQLSLIVGILLSFLQLTRKIKNSQEHDFTEKEKKEIAEYKALQIRDRNLANFLHGNVQSRLSNLASHLESSSAHQEESPPEYDGLVSEVEKIESELLAVLADFGELAISSKTELIDRITSIWRGIAEVKIEILYSEQPATVKNPTVIPLYELIFQTANEAVGNAVRHGLANQVNIKLSPEMILTVEDNGVGVREGTSGLGTEHFKAVSESWTLEDTDTGTKLTLRLNPDPII